MKLKLLKSLSLGVLCLSLFSCLPVEDFNGYWEKSRIDPGLAGVWTEEKVEKKDYLRFETRGDHYVFSSTNPPVDADVKTLDVQGTRFLMVSKQESRSDPVASDGYLLFYEIQNGKLIVYVTDMNAWVPEVEKDESAKGILMSEFKGVPPDQNPTFNQLGVRSFIRLDEKTTGFLKRLAAKKDLWKKTIYVRTYDVPAGTFDVQGAATGGKSVSQQAASFYKTLPTHTETPENVTHLVKANDLFAQGKTEDAIVEITKFVTADPKNRRGYETRVKFYKKAENWEAAEKDLSTMIELQPSDKTAYQQRSKIREKRGDKAGAEEDLNKAKELFSGAAVAPAGKTLKGP